MSKRSNRKRRHLQEDKRKGLQKSPSPAMMEKAHDYFPNQTFKTPQGAIAKKSSELLIQFAEPLLQGNDSIFYLRKAYRHAMLAWNLGNLPKNGCADRLEILLNSNDKLDEVDREEMRLMFKALIERKRRYFAEYTRIIIEVKVIGDDNNSRVQVFTAMSEEEHSGHTIMNQNPQ